MTLTLTLTHFPVAAFAVGAVVSLLLLKTHRLRPSLTIMHLQDLNCSCRPCVEPFVSKGRGEEGGGGQGGLGGGGGLAGGWGWGVGGVTKVYVCFVS